MFKFIVDNLTSPIIIVNNNTLYYMNIAAKQLYNVRNNAEEYNIANIMYHINMSKAIIDNTVYNIQLLKYYQHNVYIYTKHTQNDDLQKKISLYEDIMDKINQGIYVTDTNDSILFMNKTALQIDSLKKTDILNSKRTDLYFHYDDSFCPHSYVLDTHKELKKSIVNYNLSDGSAKRAIISTYPYHYNGQFINIYHIYQDTETLKQNIKYDSDFYNTLIKKNSHDTIITLNDIIGENRSFKSTKKLAYRVAQNSSNIMLYGETGTGKELFAQSIHNESLFASGPFVSINCAAVPDTLMESIFFGSVKGAFTGASDMPGLFEQANNGTLFLDEINSMNINLQAKLLRVLQEKKVARLGNNKQININCRIISSLNKDPMDCINDKVLRDDLYYRLSAFILEIPPLRERKNDIPLLINHFIKVYNKKFNCNIINISEDLYELLYCYDYPGNIRELQHFIESAYNLVDLNEKAITKEHFPRYVLTKLEDSNVIVNEDMNFAHNNNLNDISNNLEKNVILMTLKENGYNITKSAKKLGLTRQSLQYRIKKYNLNELIPNR